MTLEDGILKVPIDLKLWDELNRLSETTDADVTGQFVSRIHLKDKELNDWWDRTGLNRRIRPIRTKKVSINKSRKDGKRIQVLHKSVMANIPRPKLILEYSLIARDLIDQIKELQDDGGEK